MSAPRGTSWSRRLSVMKQLYTAPTSISRSCDGIFAEGDEALQRAETSTINRLNSRFHDATASACDAAVSAFVDVLSSRSEWINTATGTPDKQNL
ncbi:hypothetical protein MRBLWH7_003459 [Microbacterium sp. LWH7-1.2]|jgi:DNA-binding GntR family transcriptional regulator|uniref:hypothetical protein n=1 Tax=Microbacterium sp. LWH7-1.2 TaxID=3135257 RepID=UPI003139D47B